MTKFVRVFLFILIIIGLALIVTQKIWVPKLVSFLLPHESFTMASQNLPARVLFPKGGEILTAGESYTLRWEGGQDTVQIFLIDKSLASVGTSVSIVDRIYDIKNAGIYQYTLPANLEPGTYVLQIGDGRSSSFEVVSK